MVNKQPTRRRWAAATLGAALVAAPNVGEASVPDDPREAQAEDKFAVLLQDLYPDSHVSPPPYCSFSPNPDTPADPLATCEATVDGENVVFIGEWTDAGGTPLHFEFDVAPSDYGTPLAESATACIQNEEFDVDDFEVLDAGHSVVLDGDDTFRCVAEQLGWPEWMYVKIERSGEWDTWTTVSHDGHTITWAGETVIVYDESVS